ncbi:MAG: Gfo/Idh/MocA family oxidoreductase [Candidatus Stahlbacteria bacterium]|nr:MAG: Gfo/Idh/MocA family oxidoreductase [Candidatus Stahlbacteria bacterium]
MNNEIKVGLVGAGAVTQVEYLPVIEQSKELKLVAVCESNREKVDVLSSRYYIGEIYTDYEQMLREANIDVVIIATPNYLHTPMAISAIEYGKDVLCEMPLGLDASEVNDLGKVVDASDNILMSAFNGRFRPDVQILKDLISKGELGRISFAKAGWLKSLHEERDGWRSDPLKSGGGAIMTLGIQILGYVSWLVGLDVSSVVAGFHTTDRIEDSGIIFLRYRDGSYLMIEVGWTLLFEKDFTYFNLYGSDGVALLNPLKIKKLENNRVIDLTPSNIPKHPIKESYYNMLERFIDYVGSRSVPQHGWQDAYEVAIIIDAAYRSAEEEKEILL